MADKIMQLDGADDSSSDCEEDSCRRTEEAVDRMLSNRSPGTESVSNWSGNIMSLLSESTGFPTPQTPYQTPHTFWSDWTPSVRQTDSVWSPRNDRTDGWTESPLPDSGKNQTENEYAFPFSDAYATPFSSNHGEYFHGNYTPTSTLSPTSNVGSVYTVPPPSAVLTPASETDNYSDSVCDTASLISNSPSRQEEPRKNVEETRDKLIETLKNFGQNESNKRVSLTLKEYVKSCGDVVSVDLKKLNNKEMVVIEYKPVTGNRNKSKFLIKPLDKFLLDWGNAEKRANEKIQPKLINGFTEKRKENPDQVNTILNTLENKYTGNWLDKSKIETIKNKFVVKSVEMLPDNSEEIASKSYESFISDGKIKIKLKKPPEAVKKVPKSVEKQNKPIGSVSEIRVTENRLSYSKTEDKKISKNLKEFKNNLLLRSKANNTKKKEPAVDPNLITQINDDFEEYFQNVVKKTRREDDDSSSTSCEDSEEESKDDSSYRDDSSTNFEPVKFVSQLLTAFSCLSNSNSKIPPLSITINLGTPAKGSSPVPIQLNFQSNPNIRQKKSKKTEIDNVDGPADDSSSSEESEVRSPVVRTPSKKRPRKSGNYRPLDVVVKKSPGRKESDLVNVRKRKVVRNLSETPSSSHSDSAVGKIFLSILTYSNLNRSESLNFLHLK